MLVGGDGRAWSTAFGALVVTGLVSLGAGVVLSEMTGTLESLPGLLLLQPATLAMTGNIYGAFGSRLGTSIHAGTFRLTARLDSVVGQNTLAALVLGIMVSVVTAVAAKGVAVAFDVSPTMSLADFVVVSTVAGTFAGLVLVAVALGLAAGATRWGWDLDNVVVPVVSATGDVLAVVGLLVGSRGAGRATLTPLLALLLVAVSLVAVLSVRRSALDLLSLVVRESMPVLVVAALLDLVAGITAEKRLDDFVSFEVLLILLPGFLGAAGSLGGVLSSRLATRFHLGLIAPDAVPSRPVWSEALLVVTLSVPVFALRGVTAQMVSWWSGAGSPGMVDMVAVAVLGGILATVVVVVVGYYGTLVAVRFGLDPDTYGIPVVQSTLDVVGVFTFLLAATAVGIV